MGEIANLAGSDGGARGGEALVGVGLGVRRVFGQVAQAPGSNGGKKGGIVGEREYSRIFHHTRFGRREKKVTGCSLRKRYFRQPPFEKRKNTLADIPSARDPFLRMDPQSQICVGRSIGPNGRARESTQESDENLALP